MCSTHLVRGRNRDRGGGETWDDGGLATWDGKEEGKDTRWWGGGGKVIGECRRGDAAFLMMLYPDASSKDDQNLMGSPFGPLGAPKGPTGLHQGQIPL